MLSEPATRHRKALGRTFHAGNACNESDRREQRLHKVGCLLPFKPFPKALSDRVVKNPFFGVANNELRRASGETFRMVIQNAVVR